MRFKSSAILLLGFVCFAGSAFGQAIGAITGLVQDPSDARIPGVSVTATNTATGVKTSTVTNESGAYNFSNLAVGPYLLEAALPGFRKAQVSNIDLLSNQTLRFNLKLAPSRSPTTCRRGRWPRSCSTDHRTPLMVSTAR